MGFFKTPELSLIVFAMQHITFEKDFISPDSEELDGERRDRPQTVLTLTMVESAMSMIEYVILTSGNSDFIGAYNAR